MPQPLTNEPRDFLLGPDNDIVIGTDVTWSRGVEAVAQSCRIALQMIEGEWFLDTEAGIPYFDQILGQKPEVATAVAREEFARELLSVEGVLEILKLEVTYANTTRKMTIRWQVRTALGETPVDTLAREIP